MEQIKIFDATLYGGGQSPGASLNIEEKLEIARLLEQMGVDVIQAGFPISSPGEFKAVQRLAGEMRQSVVCALARAREEDIDVALAALKGAVQPRIQIGLGVSDSYIVGKLKTTREAALEMGTKAVLYARRYMDDVQYYAADACRADVEYLYSVLEAIIEAGATTINIPDAIGFYVPSEWGALIRGIRENVPNINKAVISVHCHNDLGMATANTLEALVNGARQAECAVNGIGERTGNACLEEIAITLHARREALGLTTGLNTRQIYPVSRLVSHLTGHSVQSNKAIVGAQAFAYTSGMYQNGVLRGRTEAEIIDPAEIGILEGKEGLSLLTGREGVRRRLREMGFSLDDDEFERVYNRFRVVAKKKPHLEVWVTNHGNGPVDAAYKAIDSIVGVPNQLLEFSVEAMTEGVDALGKVTVRIQGEIPIGDTGEGEQQVFLGRGADTDIVVASAKAYLFALNRLLAAQQAGRRRQIITEEVRQELEDMRARYGATHTGDFMGWSVLRDEELI
jgi:2-isopropylmalate synthase